MPETAVDEKRPAFGAVGNIRRSREGSSIEAIVDTRFREDAPDRQFCRRPPLPDRPHHARALVVRNDVGGGLHIESTRTGHPRAR